MKNYVLNGTGNGKKALFYFAMVYVLIILIASVSLGAYVDTTGEIATKLETIQTMHLAGVILGMILILGPTSWLMMCLLSLITSLFVTKKLEVAQRKRFAAMYYMSFSVISTALATAMIFIAPEANYEILTLIAYFVFLKVFDRKMIA